MYSGPEWNGPEHLGHPSREHLLHLQGSFSKKTLQSYQKLTSYTRIALLHRRNALCHGS